MSSGIMAAKYRNIKTRNPRPWGVLIFFAFMVLVIILCKCCK